MRPAGNIPRPFHPTLHRRRQSDSAIAIPHWTATVPDSTVDASNVLNKDARQFSNSQSGGSALLSPLGSSSQPQDAFMAPLAPQLSTQQAAISRPTVSQELLTSCLKQQGLLIRLRDNELQARTRLEFEQTKLDHYQGFATKSMSEFMKAQDHAMTHQTWNAWYPELCELHERCASDYDILKAQQDTIKRLNGELSNIRYQVMTQEVTSRTLMEGVFAAIGVDTTEIHSAGSADTPAQESADHLPPLLEAYYDRIGDVGIFQERLNDLDYAHKEARVERNFFADQRSPFAAVDEEQEPDWQFSDRQMHQWPPLDISDKEFESSHQLRRQQMLAELEAAQREADDLAAECRGVGIDPEAGMQLPPEDKTHTTASRPLPPMSEWTSLPHMLNLFDEQRAESSTILAPAVRHLGSVSTEDEQPSAINAVRQNKIRSWLGTIPTEPVTPVNNADYLRGHELGFLSGPRSISRRHSNPPSGTPGARAVVRMSAAPGTVLPDSPSTVQRSLVRERRSAPALVRHGMHLESSFLRL